jgi:hypothetical protein
MSVPPPPGSIPPGLIEEYYRLLALYYQAVSDGNGAYAQQLVQQMRMLMQTQGQGLAQSMRDMFQALQPLIRPALMAAGAAWATVTTVTAEIGSFIAAVAVGIGSAMVAALPWLLFILFLVLLYWWSWHRQREQWRAAGYPQAMHTPEDGFPSQSPIAAEFQRVMRTPLIGPLEVIEGRARAYGVG